MINPRFPGSPLIIGGNRRASLYLDFLTGEALDSRITFTRASSATRINASGVIETVSSDVARFDYDPVTLALRGLLIEEARTNLLLNSATLSTQSVTVTAAAHTLSFYGTGTVTLSGTSTAGPLTGSGAFPTRSTLTFTPTAGTLTLTVTGSVLWAQLEVGSFATSWVPTTGATATRAAEIATMPITAFPFNSAAGALIVAFRAPSYGAGGGTQRGIASLYSDANNRISALLTNNSPNAARNQVSVAGANQALIDITYTADTNATFGLEYAQDDFGACLNGGSITTDTSGSVPTVTTLGIGNRAADVPFCGHIRRLTYYPRRISDAELQQVTT